MLCGQEYCGRRPGKRGEGVSDSNRGALNVDDGCCDSIKKMLCRAKARFQVILPLQNDLSGICMSEVVDGRAKSNLQKLCTVELCLAA
jgi:hypothetical protein